MAICPYMTRPPRSRLLKKRAAIMALVVVFAAFAILPINAGVTACFQESEKAPSRFQSILAKLIAAQGVSGYETDVRQIITGLLPQGSRSRARVDEVGNLIATFGSGDPATVISAPMDEAGYVVSRITDDGYIRLNRVGRAAPSRLWDQFQEGQPVTIRTAGGPVQGVTACISIHLQAHRAGSEATRATTLEDLWVDVGVASRPEVEKLGIRLLDPVTLRNRVTELADGHVAGIAAPNRAACAILLMLADVLSQSPPHTGQVVLAWLAQESLGQKGSDRLSHEFRPQQVVRIDSTTPSFAAPGSNRKKGLTGELGAGPLIGQSSASLIALARELHINSQAEPDPRSNRPSDTAGPRARGDALLASAAPYTAGPDWEASVETMALPSAFYGTAVETVSELDAYAMLNLLRGKVGITPPSGTAAHSSIVAERAAASRVARSDKDEGSIPGYPTAAILRRLIETYSVSGSEGRMREAVQRLLPGWAKPAVDGAGNVVVDVGRGKPYRVFLAHMDEIGYVVKEINEDGTLATEPRGGGLQELYDAHPVLVHTQKGDIPGIQLPGEGYLDKPASQRPGAESPAGSGEPSKPTMGSGGGSGGASRGIIYLGTSTADATARLEIKPGDTITIPKRFQMLGFSRATGRSMDDRMGCAALLAAVRNLDPARVRGYISFVWTTGEETGLEGARFFSEHMEQNPEYVFGIDTFVSSDSPRETGRFAYAPIGHGAVIRALDSSSVVPPEMVRQVLKMAADRKVALQYGQTSGVNDGAVFTRFGAYNIPLAWPLRYSHSPVEVVDLRDLESLAALIRTMIDEQFPDIRH
jgi:putative aminopeptidase FrvX